MPGFEVNGGGKGGWLRDPRVHRWASLRQDAMATVELTMMVKLAHGGEEDETELEVALVAKEVVSVRRGRSSQRRRQWRPLFVASSAVSEGGGESY